MRRRAPIMVRSAYVSQENCRELLGVDARRFLELVVPLCAGHVTPLGKLRLVPLDVAEERLHARARHQEPDDGESVDDDHDDDAPQPESMDEVLAAIGKRRTA